MMRMMLSLGLAASLAVSKRHLGSWNHSSGRLATVSYLLLEPKLRVYEGLYQKL